MSTGQQFERPAKLSAEQAASVRSALELVISSDAFAGSKQCQDFLRLVVERALAGEVDTLSERMIGVELFGRPADYDTSNDGVVRVRAAEVRKRLAQYYREATSSPRPYRASARVVCAGVPLVLTDKSRRQRFSNCTSGGGCSAMAAQVSTRDCCRASVSPVWLS